VEEIFGVNEYLVKPSANVPWEEDTAGEEGGTAGTRALPRVKPR